MFRFSDNKRLQQIERQIRDEEERLDRLKERHQKLGDVSGWSRVARVAQSHSQEEIEEEILRVAGHLSELRERWADLVDDLYFEDVGEIEDEGR